MTAPAIIHQPELRALMMFDNVPDGCTTFLCSNESSLPHVRPGEFVIVDKTDREPIAGELYVISFGPRLDQHHICMVRRRSGIQWSRKDLPQDGWQVGAVRNDEMQAFRQELKRKGLPHAAFVAAIFRAQALTGSWSEGPYASEGDSFDHLCECLVGKVIGIYQPSDEGAAQ